MRKKLMGLILVVVVIGFSGNIYAAQTLGNFTWQLSQLQNATGQPVTLPHDLQLISLDIDFGHFYLNAYGTFSNQVGSYAQAAIGSGYLYDNDDHSTDIRMEIRSGLYLYNLELDAGTLSGAVGVYDKDGTLIAVGSIDFLGMNVHSFE